MFKFLRSRAKIFYWVIAASFILFIFLAWGMDVSGRRTASPAQTGEIGAVNGVDISIQQWQQWVRRAESQVRRQAGDREVNANQLAAAREQAWEQMVRDVIVTQEVERLGLSASDDEVLNVFRNNPPPELLAAYTDESGQPNLERYYADLSNPARDWSQEERYIRAMLPRMKLQEMITAGVTVTEAEVEEAYQRQNQKAVAELLGVIYADLETEYEPDSTAVVAHYEQHSGDYRNQARVRVEAVVWPKVPSQADLELASRDARELRDEIVAGQLDFAEAATLYSQDPGSAEKGGDLGTFDRTRMVKPFSDAAFSLAVGEISEPIETQFGYHIIEVLEQITNEEGAVDQVHARHILFKVEASDQTLGDIYEQAAAFRSEVDATTFGDVARADSLRFMEPAPFTEGRDIPGLFQSASGGYWAFLAEPGDLSPVFQNRDSYFVVLLQEKIDAGVAPMDQVRGQIVLELKRQHNRRLAEEKLSPAVGEIQMGRELAEIAAEQELTYAVTDTFTASSNIAETGYATAFNDVALASEVGELIPAVETPRGLFALRVLWRSELDVEDLAASHDLIHRNLLLRKQSEALEVWFQERRATADIVDRRHAMMDGA